MSLERSMSLAAGPRRSSGRGERPARGSPQPTPRERQLTRARLPKVSGVIKQRLPEILVLQALLDDPALYRCPPPAPPPAATSVMVLSPSAATYHLRRRLQRCT